MIDPKLRPMAYIIERTAQEWGVTADDIRLTHSSGGAYHFWNLPPLTVARHVAMLLAYELQPHRSYVELGKAFNRDRKTVMRGIDAALALISKSLVVRTRYEELKTDLSPILRPPPIAMSRRGAQKIGASQGSQPETPTLAEATAND